MTENTTGAASTAPQEKKRISIADVLKMLSEGKERKEIGDYYGLRPFEVTALFQNPKLKGKKVKRPQNLSFEIIDEAPVEQQEAQNTVHESSDAPLQ